MTAPTFFDPFELSADIVLTETIAREGASGRQNTPLVRHERLSIRGHALHENRHDLGARIALHFGKTPLSTPLRVKGRLVYEKMYRVCRLGVLIFEHGKRHTREVLLNVPEYQNPLQLRSARH